MYIIGIDFSITKPAACIYDPTRNDYVFYAWPRADSISEKRIKLYKDNDIRVSDRREDVKNPHSESTLKMRFAFENAIYLADMISTDMSWAINPETVFSFEGFSFASSGDAVLQLAGYRYILMERLLKNIGSTENLYSYAPISIKKTAGCSKKGSTKKDIIDAFLKEDTTFSKIVSSNSDFMKKGGKSYIELLDDLVDSYYCVKTYQEKNP